MFAADEEESGVGEPLLDESDEESELLESELLESELLPTLETLLLDDGKSDEESELLESVLELLDDVIESDPGGGTINEDEEESDTLEESEDESELLLLLTLETLGEDELDELEELLELLDDEADDTTKQLLTGPQYAVMVAVPAHRFCTTAVSVFVPKQLKALPNAETH